MRLILKTTQMNNSSKEILKVLVVDDESSIANAFAVAITDHMNEYLRDKNKCVEVDTAESMNEALRLILQNSYRLVLTDINLREEGFTGIHLAQTIRSMQQTMPIVAMSGHYGSLEEDKLFAFTFPKFLQEIDILLERMQDLILS
ncbi:MAG: response regulator [Proteobacteria bacterium]|nr:MAG: response regulator [Pseudomonadota bacterium]